MSFKLTLSNVIQRLDDGVFIPIDPANREYRQYLDWLALGNTPTPADPAPPPDTRRAEVLQACQDVIDDATLPLKVKQFCRALKVVL